MTFRSDQTALERAGGTFRLSKLAERLVGVDWRLEVVESTGPRPVTALLVVRDGKPYDTLHEVPLGSSPAIRGDQARDLNADARELEPILRAEVRRISGETKGGHL